MAHTTLSIQKDIYQMATKRAKKQHLSVSAIARMLLMAFAMGKIDIGPIIVDEPVELIEIDPNDLSPELRRAAEEAYKKPRSEFINIPV